MRELTTIGSLGNLRYMRAVERQSRLVSLRGMGWMGATNPNYVPPSATQVDAEPPGDALTAATLAMLEHFQTAGVPSEHISDPFVLAWQQAFNRDPASWASAHKLGTDGGFGNNSHDAAEVLVGVTGGGPVPDVNTGAAPVVPSTVIVTKPGKSTTTTTTTTTSTGLSSGAKWLLGLAAALALGWGASRMLKKRRMRRRGASKPSTAIVLAG